MVFLVYLLPWTFSDGASVMSASAAVAAAVLTSENGWVASGTSEASGSMRVLLGLGHSLAAAGLVLGGGYAVFKRVMGVLTIAMVLLVIVAAVLTRPDLSAVFGAIFVPRLPLEDSEGVQWTIALFGGIGGTATMLAYGYWMREEGQTQGGNQPSPRAWSYRIDLGIAYTVTAVFGIALTIVSTDVPVHPSGANLFQAVASRLAETVGPVATWVYLAGAWCAVCACMLGVWQFIPLLFADFVSIGRAGPDAAVTQTSPERFATKDVLSRPLHTEPTSLGWRRFPCWACGSTLRLCSGPSAFWVRCLFRCLPWPFC